MRLAFAGSPEFAARILHSLIESEHSLCVIYTQPDRARGRGRRVEYNPVKKLALEHSLIVEQPATLKTADAAETLMGYKPDVLIVAAYGLILPGAILEAPRLGCLNVHASLLPRWRGAAPIERSVMAGDTRTGVSIMQMDEGLDTGPVFATAETPINLSGSITELENKLADLGYELLLKVLTDLDHPDDPPTAVAQNDTGVSYAPKLTAVDRRLDWHQSADELTRRIWALSARMPVRIEVGGLRAQIIEATSGDGETDAEPGTLTQANKSSINVQCATGTLQITKLRIEGGKGTVLTPAEALNGYRSSFEPGTQVQ